MIKSTATVLAGVTETGERKLCVAGALRSEKISSHKVLPSILQKLGIGEEYLAPISADKE